MSLTKIGSIGINTGIQFAGVTTIATLNSSSNVLSVGGTVNFNSDVSIGGSVSIGGTLTYEDVTNIDSVGLITARNGIVVGSGITLSKDGDGFFTGVVTATSYAGSGANLTGIDTDLVSDTSPQLGGNLDVNTKNIVFGDSGGASDDRLTFGAGTDLSIYHDGTHTYLNNTTGNLRIQNNGTVKSTQFEVDLIDFNDSANSTVHVRKEPAGNVKIFKNLSVTGIATVGSAVTISESGIEASGIGITCANINGDQIGGRRNIIINGAMRVAQRGASFSFTSGYTLDRWRFDDAMDSGAATVTQSTTSPDGFTNSLKVDITTADTSLAGNDYSQVYQYIEARNLQHLAYGTSAAKTITISFYVRSNKTGGYNVAFLQDDASSRLASFQYTINSADTWERKSFTIPGDASGQINNDGGIGLSIFWGLAYGGNYTSGSLQTSFGGYVGGNFGAGQSVNLYDSTSNEWYITGVQLEIGTQATPFEHRTIAEDYRDCLRYYYESRVDGNNFGGANPNNYASGFIGFGLNDQRISAGVRFPEPMRGIPSVTMIRPSDGSAGDAHIFKGVTGTNGAADVDFGTVSAVDIGSHGFLYWSCTTNVTQGAAYLFHIKADAEI